MHALSFLPLSRSWTARVLPLIALLAGAPLGRAAAPPPPTATLPFKLEFAEVQDSKLPALHSFTSAVADGKCLIIGGRQAGLHGFNPNSGGQPSNADTNFPRSASNTRAWVLDLPANKVLGSVDLPTALPALAGPLTATSSQSIQVGDELYILGGYGQDVPRTDLTTFGLLIHVTSVAGLIDAIVNNKPIDPFFSPVAEPDIRLKICGGALKYANQHFYLVFGHDFTGHYSIENRDYNRAGGQFQKYSEAVRVFTVKHDAMNRYAIDQFSPLQTAETELPFNRRDLNVVDIITPLASGPTPAVTVYGGVFKAGQIAGHLSPVDLQLVDDHHPAPQATWQKAFQQAMNHYECAQMTVYDDGPSKSSYTTLFGGISQYWFDPETKTLISDKQDFTRGLDGLPFIRTISCIQRGLDAKGEAVFTQVIQPKPLPALLGTNAVFFANRDVPHFDNGVLKLSGMKGRTLAGYMYGGIESTAPYSGLSKVQPTTNASKHLFEVYVTPGASEVIPMPPLPTVETPVP